MFGEKEITHIWIGEIFMHKESSDIIYYITFCYITDIKHVMCVCREKRCAYDQACRQLLVMESLMVIGFVLNLQLHILHMLYSQQLLLFHTSVTVSVR